MTGMATIGSVPRYLPPDMPDGSGTARDTELDRVRFLARVLDRYLVDPLIGLVIPGGGDVLGSLLGVYTVMIAARRKVSPVIIARMLMNLAADAVIGFVPFIGDLFDIGFKANQRNVELLTERALHGGRATAKDWLIVVAAALAYIAVMALVIWGIVALFRAVF
ncbi:MAG TPA: DUF4112 domain-containing protein [Kofleriaceae bacterium]